MIQCKHKNAMVATNIGCVVRLCHLHGKAVNDDICSGCPDREGTGGDTSVQLYFPTRPEQEIERIYGICKTCPLFDLVTKECTKLKLGFPVDVYAQNPEHVCPEGIWR